MVPSIVLRLNKTEDNLDAVEARAKELLIQCATPDAVSRLTLGPFEKEEQDGIFKLYHVRQRHSSLPDFLLGNTTETMLQVTTNSRLLTTAAAAEIEQALSAEVSLISLQQFDTGKIGSGTHRNLPQPLVSEITRDVYPFF